MKGEESLLFGKIKKILIIKPSAFGDVVHTLPFLNALRQSYPDARIDWVIAEGLHRFLEGHPMIDRLWVIRKDRWKRLKYLKETLSEIAELTSCLRKEEYDVAVDLSGLLRSGLIAFASGAGIRLGFEESDEGSPLFYTHKIKGDMTIHAVDRYLKLAAALGCRTDKVSYPFAPYDDNPSFLKELPDQYVVISPSAGKSANQWPAEKFGKLSSLLPLPSVIISSSSDAAVAAEVVSFSGGKAISVAGRTGLKELIPLIRRASFFITNDTGPMHVAAALNVPVFAIFGPANPARTGPYDSSSNSSSEKKHENLHTVIRKDLECSPCYAHKPCTRWRWRCMNDLSVDEVFEIISKKSPIFKDRVK